MITFSTSSKSSVSADSTAAAGAPSADSARTSSADSARTPSAAGSSSSYSSHDFPPYKDMILGALLQDPKGSGKDAIFKYITEKYSDQHAIHSLLVDSYLRVLQSQGIVRKSQNIYQLAHPSEAIKLSEDCKKVADYHRGELQRVKETCSSQEVEIKSLQDQLKSANEKLKKADLATIEIMQENEAKNKMVDYLQSRVTDLRCQLVEAEKLHKKLRETILALSNPILSAVGERYYKVSAEALRVCGELVHVLRPTFENCAFDFKPYVNMIYKAILARLANQDQDQEVKECAISCMSLVISTFGDNLQRELPACLPILVDRMGNEITRLTAVKAFAVIANSPLRVDLSCVLEQVVSELTAFLRKANRALRQATLGTLNSLLIAYGDRISSPAYEVIVVELSTLISDMDLHMTVLALELCCTLMADRKSRESVGLTVRQKVLPQALLLIRSSLLQGHALHALQRFFASLVHSANTSFDALLDSLLSSAKPSPQSGGLSKQVIYSIARCVAVLCLAAGDQKCASTVEMLKGILKDDGNTNSAKKHLALLCLGEIGRRKDLSVHTLIETIIIESFQSPFEEIKSAASYALGNIAVGNLSKYLPFILDQIDNQQKKQYLLLHSLKEVIARQSSDKADQNELQDSYIEKILALLFNHCESEEEGVRNVVAECLGKIALIEPRNLIPALKIRTTSPTAFTRATVVIAVKYSIVERPEKIDEILYPEISTFLMLIRDDDRHVRRAAVLALSTAAHNKPNLIKGLLPEMLPLLYDQTVIKQELIRTVDLGPFKHTVDDGLEIRKAAFECVDTLLDSCLDQVNPSSFIVPYLISGLSDHYDVKMPCHLILSKLADKCPAAVMAVLDSLVEPLEKTINHKPKLDAVKQEVDRNEDMIRSALRGIASLNRISGGDCSLKFKMLINNIANSSTLAEKYNSVRSE